ncbi:MAG TPA: HAMP domain-containing sensor histidine kinase [Haliangium sp.]|nr:HAMP domain-containing sensor histidine kinase [Haliangium sp.]
MTLVDRLQAYLTRLRDQPGSFTPPSGKELAHLRQHLRARFEDATQQSKPEEQAQLTDEFQLWLEDLEAFAFQICWRLEKLAIRESERTTALSHAIDAELPRIVRRCISNSEVPTALWHAPLSRSAKFARKQRMYDLHWRRTHTVMRYAAEMRLTRSAGNLVEVTTMGEVFLQLVGRDAIRWLLALEVIQSLGGNDEWRMSRQEATELAKAGSVMMSDDRVQWFPSTLERCNELQLLRAEPGEGDDYEELQKYYVTPLGCELLAEAGSDETPFTLLAQALIADQLQAVLAPIGNAYPNAAADATVRHTRMVAHEIRNALVPVRVTMRQLWRDLDQAGQEALTREPRQAIDGNIERIFRFLDESIHLSRLASAPPEIFDVLPAIRDAIIGLDLPPRRPIRPEIGPAAGAVSVRGHRQRLVLALVNLLRNAVQAGGPEVSIDIQVTAVPERKRIQVIVDDDGPGIAPEQRAAIFQNGVSHRSDGTGHGLTLVREVIEREMSGKIACENGPRGGARFVIELPWA